ncbi:lantibiotic dehydratase family protein [Streptomycetaceae bacterium NBC_01309]
MHGSGGHQGKSVAGRWELAHPPVVRIAGVPATAMEGLRHERTAAAVDRLIELDAWLASTAERLAEALCSEWSARSKWSASWASWASWASSDCSETGTPRRQGARPELAGLRGALQAGRIPGPEEWTRELAAELPDKLARAVSEWIESRIERDRKHAELPGVLARERELAMPRLRGALSNTAFRRALGQSNPGLLVELEEWRADERRRPGPESLIRLVEYLAAASVTTSPYCMSTASGFGRWSDEGAAVAFGPPQDMRGVVEFDGVYLGGLRKALTRHPELAPATRVRVNPSLTETDGGLVFLNAAESLVAMPLLPAVRACLREVRAGTEPTRASLRDRLTRAPGCTDPDRTEEFVGKLVDAGLVEAYIPVSEHALDPIGELGRWVGRQHGESAARLARLMGKVADEQQCASRRDVPGFVPEPHVERQADLRQADLRQAVRELSAELGLDPSSGPTATSDVFHETAVLTRPVADCSLERWRPAVDDLDVVRRFMSVFDSGLPLRLTLSRYFLERFGPGARPAFVEFHQVVRTELARPAHTVTSTVVDDLRALSGPDGLAGSPEVLAERHLEEIHTLCQLREQARQAVFGSPRYDGVVRADPVALTRLMDTWPEWLVPPSSLACSVQLAEPGDGVRLVLNSAHGGHGRGPTRLAYVLSQVGGPEHTADWRVPTAAGPGPDAAVTAEFSGLMDAHLNMRMPSAPYELDFPFTVSDRPDHRRIPLSDLTVGHDSKTGLLHLFSEGLDTRVIPLHVGMMPESVLPAVARFLGWVCGPGYLVRPGTPPLLPPEEQLREEHLWPDGPDPAPGVIRHPRLECGRVVTQRARWSMPAGRVPRRTRGEAEADHLLRLTAWARAEGLPSRVVARGRGSGGAPDCEVDGNGDGSPLHLDFADPWSVALFERQVGDRGRVIFEEALPDPYAAPGTEPGTDPAPTHVTEFLVELTGTADADGPSVENARD